MPSAKKAIKVAGGLVYRTLFPVGLTRGMRIILMYHRVFAERPVFLHDPAMYVTSATLDMHIRNLLEFFEIVSLDSLIKDPDTGKRLCAITFDDGWVDNYDHAFPILRKYNVPATIFIPAGNIGENQRRFWFQDIWEIARKATEASIGMELIQYFSGFVPFWKPRSINQDTVRSLVSALKNRPAQELDRLMEDAYRKLGINVAPSPLLNWDQIAEMGHQGVTIGSHGLNHYILTHLTSEPKAKEILGSYNALKGLDLPTTDIFSYPNGDWDFEALAYVKNAGYNGAVTTNLGYNTGRTDPFLLNRIALHEEICNSPSLFWFRLFQAHIAGSESSH